MVGTYNPTTQEEAAGVSEVQAQSLQSLSSVCAIEDSINKQKQQQQKAQMYFPTRARKNGSCREGWGEN